MEKEALLNLINIMKKGDKKLHKIIK